MTSIEKKLERSLKNASIKYGWECLKLKCVGERGFPDRTIINHQGVYYHPEIKDTDKYADPLQVSFNNRLQKVKARTALINSQEKLDKFLFYVIHSLPIPADSDLTHFKKPGST